MKKDPATPVYKLIHSQEMVQYMWRYTLHMQATQIPCAVQFDEDLDFKLLARAVNIEIARNDCLRLRVFRQGLRLRQTFLDSYRLEKIRFMEFASPAQQDAFLNADAATKLDVFGGETFRIIFFRTAGAGCGVFINVSHMVMDFVAVFIFFRDLMEVYDSLKTGAPLPRPLGSYEDLIRNEQDNPALEERLEREGKELNDWVEMDRRPTFCALNGPKVLDRHSRLVHKKDLNMPFIYMPLNDATHLVQRTVEHGQSEKISAFIEANGLSPEWVIQLGFRICLSKLNRGVNDTLFWVLCPRRKTVKEKRMGGTLASPMPWREIFSDTQTFREALEQLAETQAYLFRHADVPFTTIRTGELRRFHLTLLQSCNSMMFSYLPLNKNTFGGREYRFTGYNFGHYVMPVYTITARDAKTGDYVFSYIHRLWLSTDEEVDHFHNCAVRAILAGIADPDKTIKEIMEEL